MSQPPFTIVHPANVMLAGPSRSGKTRFLLHALDIGVFQPKPHRVVWVYGEEQGDHRAVERLTEIGKLPKVEFLKNETNYADLVEGFDPTENNLLILDDQMSEAKSNLTEFDNIFTKGSHHRNVTVVFLVQNVFEKGFRTVNVTMHYLFMFKNPRDQQQIQNLGKQLYPGMAQFVREVYADATLEPFTYLLFDAHNETPQELRILSNITRTSARVYVPSSFPDLKC